MALDQALLKRIAAAKTSGGNNRIRFGFYTFVVLKVMCEKKRTGDCFIVEFKVVKAEAVADAFDAAGKPVIPNAEGTTCGQVWNLTMHESAPGNAKAFVLGLYGAPQETPEEELFECMAELVTDAQPARGMLVRAESFKGNAIKTGKNTGKLYEGINWSEIPQTPEEIAVRRAALDAPKPVEATKAA